MSETPQGARDSARDVPGVSSAPSDGRGKSDSATRSPPDLASTASDAASGIADAAAQTGRQLYESAKGQAAGFADQRKDQTAQSISDVAQAIRETGKSLDDQPNIRAFVDSAADGLEQLSGSIRDRSFSDIYSDIETFARQKPWALGAASVVVGFGIARFLKSSADSASRTKVERVARSGRSASTRHPSAAGA